MDKRRRGLLAHTDILQASSMVKALHHPGRKEDTGAVGHRSPREDIPELDMAPVGSSTRPGHMGSLRPARAGGVAIHRGIELHHPHCDVFMLVSILLRVGKAWTSGI